MNIIYAVIVTVVVNNMLRHLQTMHNNLNGQLFLRRPYTYCVVAKPSLDVMITVQTTSDIHL